MLPLSVYTILRGMYSIFSRNFFFSIAGWARVGVGQMPNLGVGWGMSPVRACGWGRVVKLRHFELLILKMWLTRCSMGGIKDDEIV